MNFIQKICNDFHKIYGEFHSCRSDFADIIRSKCKDIKDAEKKVERSCHLLELVMAFGILSLPFALFVIVSVVIFLLMVIIRTTCAAGRLAKKAWKVAKDPVKNFIIREVLGIAPPSIRNYTGLLHETTWNILYDYADDMPPLKQPKYPQDVVGMLIDNISYKLTVKKKNTAPMEPDTVEDYRMLIESELCARLYQRDVNGTIITSPFADNSYFFRVAKCEDLGRFFRIVIEISTFEKEAQRIAEEQNSADNPPELRDDDV